MVTTSEAAKAGVANETATSNALRRDFIGASSLLLELLSAYRYALGKKLL
jgi:hypothetical protein